TPWDTTHLSPFGIGDLPMIRCLTVPVLFALLLAAAPARADAFDNYTNAILKKVAEADGAKQIKQLTPVVMAEHDQVLPKTDAAFLVLQTNDNHFSKLLVRSGYRKLDAEHRIPMLIIERFVTYKEG